MAKDTEKEYAVSPLEAEPGESGLTPLELSYLKAAGIDPHLLNEMDRDDVIHFLVMHPDRVENPRIGDIAALIYDFGLLREMLEGDIASDDDDDDSDDDTDDNKNKNRKHRRKDVRQDEQQLIQEFDNSKPGEFYTCHKIPESYYMVREPHSALSPIDKMIAELNAAKLGIVLDSCDGPVAPDKTPASASDDSANAKLPGKPPETWVEAVREEAQDAAARKADVGNGQ